MALLKFNNPILRGLCKAMTIRNHEYLPFEDQMTNLKVCSQNHPGNASSQNSRAGLVSKHAIDFYTESDHLRDSDKRKIFFEVLRIPRSSNNFS